MNPPKLRNLAVIFTVKDTARTKQFYQETLGIPIEDHQDYLQATLPGGNELVFFQGEPSPGNSPYVVFGLDQGGIDALAESLTSKGVSLITPVTEAPGGWSVDFRDPDGHSLSYYQEARYPR